MPVIGVGQINDLSYAEKILFDGQGDTIALARPVIYNPKWLWHAAEQLGPLYLIPRNMNGDIQNVGAKAALMVPAILFLKNKVKNNHNQS